MIKKHHSHQYYGGDDFSRGYDPFRLVPTTRYDDNVPAPFDVEINSDCLVKKKKKKKKCSMLRLSDV
jgi:protein MYSM1